jgi:CBS domain-containing membrane protein
VTATPEPRPRRGARSRLATLMTSTGHLLGIELAPVTHVERAVSTIGAVIAIYILITIERSYIGETGAALLVASMGASAVLLYAVPHGSLSQPWAVLVGHVVSAIVGVTCARLVSDVTLAAALSVGLAIGAMHYLRAIHPPGGATALTAVIAGPEVHALGYQFVLTPVFINALIMVGLAMALNALFPWRRYPAALGKTKRPSGTAAGAAARLTHADFISALRRMGTFVDINEDDFLQLQALAQESAARRSLNPDDIRLGSFYTNDALGSDWAIRRIVDDGGGSHGGSVIWRCVAGHKQNETGLCSRRAFAAWAAYEVTRAESTWIRARPEQT